MKLTVRPESSWDWFSSEHWHLPKLQHGGTIWATPRRQWKENYWRTPRNNAGKGDKEIPEREKPVFIRQEHDTGSLSAQVFCCSTLRPTRLHAVDHQRAAETHWVSQQEPVTVVMTSPEDSPAHREFYCRNRRRRRRRLFLWQVIYVKTLSQINKLKLH